MIVKCRKLYSVVWSPQVPDPNAKPAEADKDEL